MLMLLLTIANIQSPYSVFPNLNCQQLSYSVFHCYNNTCDWVIYKEEMFVLAPFWRLEVQGQVATWEGLVLHHNMVFRQKAKRCAEEQAWDDTALCNLLFW